MDLNTQETVNIQKNMPLELEQKGAQNDAGANLQQEKDLTPEQIAKKVETDIKKVSFKDEFKVANATYQVQIPYYDLDFASTYNFDTIDISREDAEFFLDLIEYNKKKENTAVNIANINAPIDFTPQQDANMEVQASNKIISMLEQCINTKKPVRIDFDNNITLVMQVHKDGKISAHFYPSDKAAEEYLRNNIASLKQKFDDENILYSYLGYGKQKGNNEKERQEKK